MDNLVLPADYRAVLDPRHTERFIAHEYDEIEPALPDEITFVHSEDLAREYPEFSPRERETRVCREAGAVFIIGIGGQLPEGDIHDGRAHVGEIQAGLWPDEMIARCASAGIHLL